MALSSLMRRCNIWRTAVQRKCINLCFPLCAKYDLFSQCVPIPLHALFILCLLSLISISCLLEIAFQLSTLGMMHNRGSWVVWCQDPTKQSCECECVPAKTTQGIQATSLTGDQNGILTFWIQRVKKKHGSTMRQK